MQGFRKGRKENSRSENAKAVDVIRKADEDTMQTFEALVSCSPLAIIAVDRQEKVTTWNPAAERIFGWKAREVIGGPNPIVSAEKEDEYRSLLKGVMAGSACSNVRTKRRREDGSDIEVEISASPVFCSKRGICGVMAVMSDVTDRESAEEALRNSEEKYRKLVDNAPIGIYKASLDGRFLYVNKALAASFEFDSPEEMMSESVLARYRNPRDREIFLDQLRRSGRVENFELATVSKTGGMLHLLISSTLEGDTISGMVLDVTEQKKLEAQLRHAQKMEAIGTLAGGVAHDFNNILNAIMGYGSLVSNKLEADSPSKGYMNEVIAAAERAATLTRRLLAFSRKQVAEMRPVDVNEIILGVEKMISRIIGEDIACSTEITAEKTIVMADVGQIEQVLINLASNARDAMPEGGKLIISTGIRVMDDAYIASYGYGKTGSYALISVTDTGKGMDADTQKKIFEPFFTTKGVGEGTGLGLAIVYGIVKQHNGYVNVYSEEGYGTTFKILLPLLGEEKAKGRQVEKVAAIEGGTETILLAEDDAAIREMSKLVLESFGYSVLAAKDGEDAIRKHAENSDSIKLVILDMIMPKKSGRKAYEEIVRINPGIKALFVSGYTMDMISGQDLLEEGMDFILKPVSPNSLLKKVREVLDR